MQNRRGFTLVELSIVLVILGLLVGGVLTGQSLIRAAELRSVATEYNGFKTALNAFKDKYFTIPGDMTNATAFWGAAHATPATCRSTVGTGTATCNGDGDGRINYPASSSEVYRFWQHLANAGLIQGNYTGVDTSGSSLYSTTLNSPVSKLPRGMWFTYDWAVVSGGASWLFNGDYNNTLSIGGADVNTWPSAPLFKPEDAWNIDTKLDDGKPATGKLFAVIAAGTCTPTGTTGATDSANYNLANTAPACVLVFPQAY